VAISITNQSKIVWTQEIKQTYLKNVAQLQSPPPVDACLREAASAKAGGRARVGVDKMKTFWVPPPLRPLPPWGGDIFGRICLINYGLISKKARLLRFTRRDTFQSRDLGQSVLWLTILEFDIIGYGKVNGSGREKGQCGWTLVVTSE
jgi:hypothetical protein